MYFQGSLLLLSNSWWQDSFCFLVIQATLCLYLAFVTLWSSKDLQYAGLFPLSNTILTVMFRYVYRITLTLRLSLCLSNKPRPRWGLSPLCQIWLCDWLSELIEERNFHQLNEFHTVLYAKFVLHREVHETAGTRVRRLDNILRGRLLTYSQGDMQRHYYGQKWKYCNFNHDGIRKGSPKVSFFFFSIHSLHFKKIQITLNMYSSKGSFLLVGKIGGS
jgi:hypothetical protein